MIQVNEVRVGNNLDYCGKLLIVEPQDFEGVRFADCEGILITEKILLASGFKPDMVYKYRFSIDSFILHRTIDKGMVSETFTLALDYGNQLRTDTKYVHQLQNLFYAITGKEIKIQL